MTAPLFSVGEEVIVVSKIFGRFDAVVTRVLWRDKGCGTDGKIGGPGFRYFVKPSPNELPFIEGLLRKKPRPSSQSFDEIMQSIKQGSGVVV